VGINSTPLFNHYNYFHYTTNLFSAAYYPSFISMDFFSGCGESRILTSKKF
jgi:hypothetical protein